MDQELLEDLWMANQMDLPNKSKTMFSRLEVFFRASMASIITFRKMAQENYLE